MAKFELAMKKTAQFEGGFSNKATDKGGYTYKGITRKNWPDSEIAPRFWERVQAWVDKYGGDHAAQGKVFPDRQLDDDIVKFYKKRYWDVFHGDYISEQHVANHVFDFTMNSGKGPLIINQALQPIAALPIKNAVTMDTVRVINSDPRTANDLIADARFEYVKNQTVKVKNKHTGEVKIIKQFEANPDLKRRIISFKNFKPNEAYLSNHTGVSL